MHSDSWAGMADSQCPPDVVANRRTCEAMDRFYAAANANEAAALRVAAALFEGGAPDWPAVERLTGIDDDAIRWLMETMIAEATAIAALLTGKDERPLIEWAAGIWRQQLKRADDYLAYNRTALHKRIVKRAEPAELDRVQRLIDKGVTDIGRLRPRVEWAAAWLAKAGTS